MIAALYVDTKRGPYSKIPGVVCYGIDQDATKQGGRESMICWHCGLWVEHDELTEDGECPFCGAIPDHKLPEKAEGEKAK